MARVDADELQAFASSLVRAFGSPDDIAETVAASLVRADLSGHGSHGVRRLAEFYPRMIEAENIDPAGRPEVVRDSQTTARVDGNWGWGHVTSRFAIDRLIGKAREHGVAVVGVSNGTHMGRIGELAEYVAGEDLILVGFVNTGGTGRTSALPGTTERNISANPFVIGVPSFGAEPFDIVMDISTSQTAHGKILKRAIAGDSLSDNWVIDDGGNAMLEADRFESGDGAILPLGGMEFGYKGAALSLAIEAVVGQIGDATVHGEGAAPMVNNGATFIGVDPTRFLTREACRRRIERLVEHVRSQPYDPSQVRSPGKTGSTPVVPGEPEHNAREQRGVEGIPLDTGAVEALRTVASRYDVEEVPSGFETAPSGST